LIVIHSTDADTISCALALSNYFYENKIKHKVFNLSKEIPRELNFLSRFDKITDQLPKFYDLIIYVDCADKKRVPIELNDVKIINIDHHQSNDFFGDINIVDDSKASSAEILYEILEKENFKISKNMATCLYVGIYDDSIAFTTPRVDKRTFEIVNKLVEYKADPSYISTKLLHRDSLAKYRIMPKILDTIELNCEGKIATVHMEDDWLHQTGASTHECDDIVNMVLNIKIVEVVAYFRIVNKGTISFRANGKLDVSKLSKELFNGGGHKNASGGRILNFKDIYLYEDAKEIVEEILND